MPYTPISVNIEPDITLNSMDSKNEKDHASIRIFIRKPTHTTELRMTHDQAINFIRLVLAIVK